MITNHPEARWLSRSFIMYDIHMHPGKDSHAHIAAGAPFSLHLRHVESLEAQNQRRQRNQQLVASVHQNLSEVQQTCREDQWLQSSHVQVWPGKVE